MNSYIFVVCPVCRKALALEWDHAAFLTDNPLKYKGFIEGESATTAILYGFWPDSDSAPSPLAAGAWAALAAIASGFVREHLSHPDTADIFITDRQPSGVAVVHAKKFVFPEPKFSKLPPNASEIEESRWTTIEQRISLASKINTDELWNIIESRDERTSGALLLAGWLPDDSINDKRLSEMVPDSDYGQAAEEAVAVRTVLKISDPETRLRKMIETAASAYARQSAFYSTVRPTPYDKAAPAEQLRTMAVERMTSAGRIEHALNLCRLWSMQSSMQTCDGLREAVCRRISDPSVPADSKSRLIKQSESVFPDLISDIRRKSGIACDPLPDQKRWASLSSQERTIISLTVSNEALGSALSSDDVSQVLTALEVIRTIGYISRKEAAVFTAEILSLCRDTRLEPKPVQSRLCARARDVHAVIFPFLKGEKAWNELEEIINAMISAGLGSSLRIHFRSLETAGISVSKTGDLLVRLVADRSRSVNERIQAREALSALADETPAVNTKDQQPSSSEGLKAAHRADDILIAALADPAESDEFKSAIRNNLARWMPHRIKELQKNVINKVTVPSVSDLQPGQSIAEIDRDEIFSLLYKSGTDTGRVLAAIALAEPLVCMIPDLSVKLEFLLRSRMTDFSKYTDRGRTLTVAMEAQYAHSSIWKKLKPEQRPAVEHLMCSIAEIAAVQGAPAPYERKLAAELAATVAPYLDTSGISAISTALESILADRKRTAWNRLHAYHALSALMSYNNVNADRMLFSALSDPDENPVLRKEAHRLLAFRMAEQVHGLQSEGLLEKPAIPPIGEIFHNLPMFERDTEGEWLLTPEAMQFAGLVFPDDLISVLTDHAGDPSCACAAAALAPHVAGRLPDLAGQIATALQNAMERTDEVNTVVDGRSHTFRLASLCAESLKTSSVSRFQ